MRCIAMIRRHEEAACTVRSLKRGHPWKVKQRRPSRYARAGGVCMGDAATPACKREVSPAVETFPRVLMPTTLCMCVCVYIRTCK